MRILKISIIPILLVSFLSCNRNTQAEDDCSNYPRQIDSLQVQDLYDTARWYLFTWLCDQQDYDRFYGEFELRYNSFLLRHDTLEIFFRNYLPEQVPADDPKANGIARSSMGFDVKTKRKLWTFNIDGFSQGLGPGDERFDNPRSAKVVEFIKANKQKLNPCFVELAKKMNVLDE